MEKANQKNGGRINRSLKQYKNGDDSLPKYIKTVMYEKNIGCC